MSVDHPRTFAAGECELEPIHIPGTVQSFGTLLVLAEPDLRVIQFSENACNEFGITQQNLLGTTLEALFGETEAAAFRNNLLTSKLDAPNRLLATVSLPDGRKWTAAVHRWDGVLFVELLRAGSEAQSASTLQIAVRKTIADLDACHTLMSFCQSAAEHFREVTGFDRVMIYRFLPDQSGVVIAESRSDDLETFLGLRYPASDIPPQARKLYLASTYRITANVNAPPVKLIPNLNPLSGKPLDLSYCSLRATSPYHLEYLRNMGVTASLSFSIIRESKLWGLVACHDRSPKVLSEEARGAGEILTRLLGLQVGIKEDAERKSYADGLQKVSTELAARLEESGDFALALVSGPVNLLSAIDAGGVALCTASKVFCLGKTPATAQIEHLRTWLQHQPWQQVWSTEKLSEIFEPGRELASVASGVLALQLFAGSPEAVIWFRPELVEVVKWAGNPNETGTASGAQGPLGPKRSFKLWQEQVRSHSGPWNTAELLHAAQIRDAMSQALLRHRALEINRLNSELVRSNRELERFSAIASHDLQEPLRTITMHTELLFRRAHLSEVPNAQQTVEFIRSATERMSKLVSSLLEYAQTGARSVTQDAFEMEGVVKTALDNLKSRIAETGADIRVGVMPRVLANKDGIVQLVQNLLSNALKYARPGVSPEISIQAKHQGAHWLFSVADNGIGFEPELAEAIFEPFRRLHGRELSGSGLGLAICRRIVESSGGQIWADARPGKGATFLFTLQPAGYVSAVHTGAQQTTVP